MSGMLSIIAADMKPITELWDEIRAQAEAAFWLAFELNGYGREFLKAPPPGEDGKAWTLAKIAAYRALHKKQAELYELYGVAQHPEILCAINDTSGMECPF